MKRRWIVLLLALALLAGGIWGYRQYHATYITIDAVRYGRDVTQLDLSGTKPELDRVAELKQLKKLDLRDTGLTAAEFEQLSRQLPECDILWSVPFQGSTVRSDVTTLSVTALEDGDVDMLGFFPELEQMDATGCHAYAQIAGLMTRYPRLDVMYQVELEGTAYPHDTKALTLSGENLSRLEQLLRYLPQVKDVKLTQPVTDGAGLRSLLEAYPHIGFEWTVDAFGTIVEGTVTELDCSGIPMTDTARAEEIAACLPQLTKVLMCDCGISNEEMEALNLRNPGVQFVWTVDIGPYITLRTDVDNFMPVGQFGAAVFTEDCANLRYCTEIRCLDLGHQPIYACDFVAYMPHLQYLILADTRVEDISALEGLKELVFLEIFLTNIKDMSPLLGCTALEDLNVCYTYGDPEVFARMPWLKRLWWEQSDTHGLNLQQQQWLQEQLPDTEIEFNCFSSTGGTWRFGQRYYEMRDMLGREYMQG